MFAKAKQVKQRGKARKAARKAKAAKELATYQNQLQQARLTIEAQQAQLAQVAAERDLYELGHVKPREGQMMTIVSGSVSVDLKAVATAERLGDLIEMKELQRDIGKALLDSGAVYFGVANAEGQLSWRCNAEHVSGGYDSWRDALKTITGPRPWEQ